MCLLSCVGLLINHKMYDSDTAIIPYFLFNDTKIKWFCYIFLFGNLLRAEPAIREDAGLAIEAKPAVTEAREIVRRHRDVGHHAR